MQKMRLRGAVALAALALGACGQNHQAQVARGKYLVTVMGCSDCHTPGGFTPKPDMSRYLGGSDIEFEMTGIGVFTPPNLTPDKATGLGNWTEDQIVTAITTGVIPSGRILAPAMPWQDFAHLSKDDARDIAAYLETLQPVSHAIPPPGAPKPAAPGVLFTVAQRPA
ncbi:MAG TPA: cytochrome c [Caulobacteraceae bacterium]|nr:cytochrome c [Caulobacteraceae bacterium]